MAESPQEPPSEVPAFEERELDWIAITSTVRRESDGPGEVIDRALTILGDAVSALRSATGVSIPQPTIERMWPVYLTAHSETKGRLRPNQLVVVEHGRFGSPRPASADQLHEAQGLLLGRLARNPNEAYRDLATQCRCAAHHDGDYTKAVLTAATASEVLIKSTAWMLTFEASEMDEDPVPQASNGAITVLKPAQLIGRVLQPRLRGDWGTARPQDPMGMWRHKIARVRSAILHLGHRATAEDADEAVLGIAALEKQICDRLAQRCAIYPRTALALVGTPGLTKRGRLHVVEALLGGLDISGWVETYLQWIGEQLDKAPGE